MLLREVLCYMLIIMRGNADYFSEQRREKVVWEDKRMGTETSFYSRK